MARSRITGLAEMQSALRAFPEMARRALVKPLEDTGKELASAMQAKAPSKSGRLRAALKYKVFPRSLRLIVGLLEKVGDRADYGRIQDLGRKAQVVTVRRDRAGFAKKLALGKGKIMASGNVRDTYLMRVRAMPGKKFVTGSYKDLRVGLREKLGDAYDEAAQTLDKA